MKSCPYCRRAKPFKHGIEHHHIKLKNNKCSRCGFEIIDTKDVAFIDFFEVVEG